MIKKVIEVATKKKKYIGICGQAPSDYPEFAKFLVECGIESMSLNPDTMIKTRLAVAEIEKKFTSECKISQFLRYNKIPDWAWQIPTVFWHWQFLPLPVLHCVPDIWGRALVV